MSTDTTYELLLSIPPGEHHLHLCDFAEDHGIKINSALSYAQKAIRLGYGLKIVGTGSDKRVFAPEACYDKIQRDGERYWLETLNDRSDEV